jgi:hypothetical protein
MARRATIGAMKNRPAAKIRGTNCHVEAGFSRERLWGAISTRAEERSRFDRSCAARQSDNGMLREGDSRTGARCRRRVSHFLPHSPRERT